MGSIVEEKQQSGLNIIEDKDLERPVLKLGYKGSLEDDINQLFQSINIRTTSTMIPSYQINPKKPLNPGSSRSPIVGSTEPSTLKQALRDLCISKASETAAMKRGSEIGKTKNIYGSVRSEDDEGKAVLVEDKKLISSSGIKTVVGLKSVRKVRLLYANTYTSTIVNGRRIPKLTRRKKVSVKTKVKQETFPENVYDEVDGFYNPVTKELLCHKCHYALKNEACKDSIVESVYNYSHCDDIVQDDLDLRTVKPIIDDSVKDFSSSCYENSREISANAETNLDSEISLASSVEDLPEDGLNDDPKNSEKEVENLQKDSFFSSDQSVEIGSFSEMNADGTEIEEIDENIPVTIIKAELSRSSKDSMNENSTSTSMSEEEEETDINRTSFGNRPHMSKDVRWEAIQHIKTQNGSLGLRHFNLLKKLGCGDIGTVYLAELTNTNCLFAIKVMDNEFLVRRNKMSRAQTEKEILKMLDHPFLPTLYSHFISDNLSCLVMECCPGGDLHVLRQKQPGRCFPEPAARFYVAEVLLALEYLHMLGVIYRDLKPENILVREDGHIMVTDFDLSLRCQVNPTLLKSSSSPLHGNGTNSSCIEPLCFRPRLSVKTKKGKKKPKKSDLIARFRSLPQLVAEPTDARSNSFVGTHEYLAPEIIKGEGHGAAVDWWTFGIFLYEILYGRTPFKGSTNEETLANVVLQNLKFPDHPNVSFQAKDLIRNLLVKEPENRLGNSKGAAEIKRHEFFQGLNWALIRCAIPPELPDVYEYHEGNKTSYLECKAIGQHLEFDLF